ncbi:nuclear transport factor 2 family protein [Actinomadura sp. 7K507]|uniref:nuclear transport factor 2 family protein n=1 Tax=Actinomadura sp. 7K507 TaxID=2530365 RepID=UPI00104613B7|nr:nuclear transport factor 2 family protein [Actinomadura sp. 7K507]TDC86868.1 nuclear transport factor 2 family protein [Actinomadura sp. 7K507]
MTLGTGDRVELLDLVSRYALYADRRDLPGVAGLFTEDAVLVLPDPPGSLGPARTFAGRDGIVEALSTLNDVPVTSHEIVGQVFEADATGHVTCVAHHLTEREPGKPSDLIWHMRYSDVYRREDGGWRFARRALQIDFIETRPVRRWRVG